MPALQLCFAVKIISCSFFAKIPSSHRANRVIKMHSLCSRFFAPIFEKIVNAAALTALFWHCAHWSKGLLKYRFQPFRINLKFVVSTRVIKMHSLCSRFFWSHFRENSQYSSSNSFVLDCAQWSKGLLKYKFQPFRIDLKFVVSTY